MEDSGITDDRHRPTSPFTPRISSHAPAAEREVRRFLRRHRLFRCDETADYYESSCLGYLTASIYPDADRDRLMIVSRWYGAWTMFDDQLEKVADVRPADAVSTIADVMLSWLGTDRDVGEPGPTPFAPAFAQTWGHIRAVSSPTWRRRFLIHTEDYLAGCRWEAENRHAHRIPDLDSYVVRRRRFGGIRMAMDLSEFSGAYELPARLYADPRIQELLDVLGDITLWGNDLFSVEVDREEGNTNNMVFVLSRQHGCDLASAATMTTRLLDDRVRRLTELAADIDQWCGELTTQQHRDVLRFVEGARTWISGNISWSSENTRYRTARPRVTGSQPNFLLWLVP
jgi:hypothetical protein